MHKHLSMMNNNKQQYAQTFINDECLTEHALVDFDDFSYTPNFVFGGGGN